MRCRNCGFENPTGIRFCGNCGTPTDAVATAAEERKHVTVVFTDVVASTELAGLLDAEHVREQLGRLFETCRTEIERYGGTVEKFIGDAVMAVFGLPTIHEDDPERAVRAALAIQARVRPHVEAGTLPQIRIGIATGEVVANPRATAKGDFMVTGEIVNLAARLQQHAAPGQILVGESTYAVTHWAFDYEKLPPLEVKGRQGPIVAYECLSAPAQVASKQRSFLQAIGSPMVGRSSELAAFMECLQRLRAGQGGILLILGEAGLGKSRLVAEARRQAPDSEVRWLEGRALSFSQTISYWPFQEIIKTATGIAERDTPEESWTKLANRLGELFPNQASEILPYMATLLGLEVKGEWAERVKYLDGEAMGRQIYRSSRLFFERLARERPSVLVFEDLHWADQSSLELLDHLFPLVTRVPLVICGLGRPGPESAFRQVRQAAARSYADRCTEISLTPLSSLESTQLIHNLLQDIELPGRFRETILQKTEGNPFFVEEVIRHLVDMRAIVPAGTTGGWHVSGSIDQMAIPNTLRGVIMARVDRLDEVVKQVLKTAAVIGRTFFYRVLRVVEDADRALDHHLDELLQLDLIRERRRVPELEYLFKHALTQDATYDSILVRRRAELHRRVGEAIEILFADRLEEFFGVLAYHYARAEEWDKAQDYLFKAGDQAGHVAADAEALSYYQQASAAYAHAFGDRWDPLQRAVLERKMGEALFRRGDHQQATEYLYRALAHLGSPFPTSRWSVMLTIAREVVQQVRHRLRPRASLLQVSPSSQPVAEERTRIYEAMGWIDYYVNVKRFFLDGLLLLNDSERYGLRLGIVPGATGLGVICDLLGFFRLAGHYHGYAVELAEQTQHPLAVGTAYIGIGFHQRHVLGNTEQALESYQRSAAAYRAAGELRKWAASAVMVAWVSRLRGDVAQSLTQSQELIRIGQEAADPEVWGWGLGERGRALMQAGDIDEAVMVLQAGIELFKGVPDYRWVVITSCGLAQCYLRQGKLHEALALLEEGEQILKSRQFRGFHRTQPRIGLPEAYLVAAEVADNRERPNWLRKAKRACKAAIRQSKLDREAAPSAYRAQGTLEWLWGQRMSAVQWWRRSLVAAEGLSARYETGLTWLEMGKRLGNHAYLEQAGSIFKDIGARREFLRVRESLKNSAADYELSLPCSR